MPDPLFFIDSNRQREYNQIKDIISFSKLNKVVTSMNNRNPLAPIPNQLFADPNHIDIVSIEDPLICISDIFQDIMVFQPKYYECGIPGAIPQIYVRKTVSEMLLSAARALPAGFKLKIFDAWRPFAVQKALYDDYFSNLRQAFEGKLKSDAELHKMASLFVSYPSTDPNSPFVHSTGGAVDLTIVDPSGKELNMGTDFDEFSDAAHTAYFETGSDIEIRDNRRLLYHTMLSAGFTNYPSEWWHYDYGDRFWAAITNRKSIYPGIYMNPSSEHPHK